MVHWKPADPALDVAVHHEFEDNLQGCTAPHRLQDLGRDIEDHQMSKCHSQQEEGFERLCQPHSGCS